MPISSLAMRFLEVAADIPAAWWNEWISFAPQWLRRSEVCRARELVLEPGTIAGIIVAVGAPKEVVIQLRSEHVLHRSFQLPNASGRTLRKMVKFELERISPVDPTRIVYDLRV